LLSGQIESSIGVSFRSFHGSHPRSLNALAPERIAQARLQSLHKIPYFSSELAQRMQATAQQSVAGLRATIALVRDLVAQVRHCQRGAQRSTAIP
jgi:hypothetical protein